MLLERLALSQHNLDRWARNSVVFFSDQHGIGWHLTDQLSRSFAQCLIYLNRWVEHRVQHIFLVNLKINLHRIGNPQLRLFTKLLNAIDKLARSPGVNQCLILTSVNEYDDVVVGVTLKLRNSFLKFTQYLDIVHAQWCTGNYTAFVV